MKFHHTFYARARRALAALICLAAMLPAGCTRNSDERVANGERSPMILFAIDGLDWNIMGPLLIDGRLPNTAQLLQRGAYGHLASMRPTFSPVIWTSIATGKTPNDHGIQGYVFKIRREDGSEDTRYYTSGHRQTKAFWNILSDYGLKVHCIGWWITYPAESINGVMVTQTNTTAVLHDPDRALWKGSLLKGVEGQVYPPDMQNRVMDVLDGVDASLDSITEEIFGKRPYPTTKFSQSMWDQTKWAFRADATYIRVARDLLQTKEPFDLLALYIGGPDVAGHRFWRYAHPDEFTDKPPKEQIENFGHVIENYYVYVDRVIGELVALAPPDATIMIVSDHGMHSTNEKVTFDLGSLPLLHNSGHHEDGPPGVFIAAGSRIRATREQKGHGVVGGVLDVLQTILALKGIPCAEDMRGRPMMDIIDTDWLDESPVRYIHSHDTPEWAATRENRKREAIDESERLEQLRSLGYIR